MAALAIGHLFLSYSCLHVLSYCALCVEVVNLWLRPWGAGRGEGLHVGRHFLLVVFSQGARLPFVFLFYDFWFRDCLLLWPRLTLTYSFFWTCSLILKLFNITAP